MFEYADNLSTSNEPQVRVLRSEGSCGAPSLFQGTLGAMASVSEVASHIWTRLGAVEPSKLHRLAYYVQAWSLVWRGRPAFDSRLEAAEHGPCCPELQAALTQERGSRVRSAAPLSGDDQAHVDRVLVYYGHMTAEQLREIVCEEAPWRAVSRAGSRSEPSLEITCASMRGYYAEQWEESSIDNASLRELPAFEGTVDELEQFLRTS